MNKETLRTELQNFADTLINGYTDETTILEILGTNDCINDYVDNELKDRWTKLDSCDCGALKELDCCCEFFNKDSNTVTVVMDSDILVNTLGGKIRKVTKLQVKDIYTFNYFWQKFHEVTRQNKLNKDLCSKLWNNTISSEAKKTAIKGIHKTIKVNAYEYLKRVL